MNVKASMEIVSARFRHNVNGSAARRTQIRPIIAAFHLKLLDGILAQGQPHAAAIATGLACIDGDAVSPAVTSVEGETALGCLLDAKILVVGQPSGVRDARQQQRKGKVIAAVDGESFNILLFDGVGLLAALGLDDGCLRSHFHDSLGFGDFVMEVERDHLTDGDYNLGLNLGLKAGKLGAYAIMRRRKARHAVLAAAIRLNRPLNTLLYIGDGNLGVRNCGTVGNGDPSTDLTRPAPAPSPRANALPDETKPHTPEHTH